MLLPEKISSTLTSERKTRVEVAGWNAPEFYQSTLKNDVKKKVTFL
jgi:hypothetical protein